MPGCGIGVDALRQPEEVPRPGSVFQPRRSTCVAELVDESASRRRMTDYPRCGFPCGKPLTNEDQARHIPAGHPVGGWRGPFRHRAGSRGRSAGAIQYREVDLNTRIVLGRTLLALPLAERDVNYMCAGDNAQLTDNDPNSSWHLGSAVKYPDPEAIPVRCQHGATPISMIGGRELTSAALLAMITPVSPPIFSPNSIYAGGQDQAVKDLALINLVYYDLVSVVSHWYSQQVWSGLQPLVGKELAGGTHRALYLWS
jgi:hypothetical protein